MFDLDATEEDMLLHAQRGGTRGIACQIGGEGSSKWLEYMQASDTWLRANIEVFPGLIDLDSSRKALPKGQRPKSGSTSGFRALTKGQLLVKSI